MSERAADPRKFIAPALMGAYAAAIALAPRPEIAVAIAAPLVVVPLIYWAILKRDQWLEIFFAAAFLLPPLPFGFGNSGPHAALLVAGLGILAGLFRLGDWRVPFTPLGRAFGIFFLILMGTSTVAYFYSGAAVALGSLTRVLLFGVSVYVFFYAAYGPGARQPRDTFATARLLYWIAVASALFACVDFYFQFPAPAGFGAQFIWLRSGVYRRAQGLFYEASTLGNFCAFFLVMIVAALFEARREAPVSRWGLLLGGTVFAAALVLSFSRGSLLNLLVAACVLLYWNRDRIRLGRLLLGLTGSLAAMAVALWLLLPSFAGAYWMRVATSVEYVFSETEGLLSGRVASWRAVGGFLIANPWHALFGIGYKTLPYSNYLGRPIIADNMYLSLLAETGIVGLSAMIWMSVEILRAAGRAARSPDIRRRFFGRWILAFWAGQMVQMFTGDLLTYWRVLPLYFWVLAAAVRHEHSVS
ncbi:MAG: O-antigen ligase family protein [Bryobacteraceae bacterium]|jgi:O-antigen ligase